MKNHKFKKIILVTNTLTAGGAENMLLNLARSLSKENYSVTLISTADVEDFFKVPAEVERIKLDQKGSFQFKLLRPLIRAFRLRKILKSLPDATVISFLENINILVILSGLFLPNKIIISMRNHPSMKKVSFFMGMLREILYPFSSLLVVQTESIKVWCLEHNLQTKIAIVPNYIADEYINSIPSKVKENQIFTFLAAGRLVSQKGFDLLIEASNILLDRGMNFNVHIFGEGPLLGKLQSAVKGARLEEVISFKPTTKKLNEEMANADAFVLSSRFEGFPNVLLEAMAQGKPVVSFDCPSGPKEIITDFHDGLLVEAQNATALADKMQLLMNNSELRAKIAKNASNVKNRFSEKAVMQQWLLLIDG